MNTKKRFTRVTEDFVCEHCGIFVHGNGYTNHCPACLWSKHVDVYPGDRDATCKGCMEPVRVEIQEGVYVLTHRCVVCGIEKRNKSVPGDAFETLLQVARNAPCP